MTNAATCVFFTSIGFVLAVDEPSKVFIKWEASNPPPPEPPGVDLPNNYCSGINAREYIEKDHIDNYRAAFNGFDTSKDGTISVKELDRLLRMMNIVAESGRRPSAAAS